MTILDTFNVVESERPIGYDPIRSRRKKLSAAIDDQLSLIAADRSGVTFRKAIVKRHRDLETDVLMEREERRRVVQWWWHGDDGQVHVQIRYGSAVIPLADDRSVFAVPDLEALGAALSNLRKAVLAGELDLALANAARALKERFSPKRKAKS